MICYVSEFPVEVRLCFAISTLDIFCIFFGSIFLRGLMSLCLDYFDLGLRGRKLSMDWLKTLFLMFFRGFFSSCKKEELLLLLV